MSALVPERDVPVRQLRSLQGIYLAQTSIAVLTRVVACSWLLEELGSRDLPWVYLLQAIPLCLLTFALFGLVDRVGRASLMTVLPVAFATGVMLAWALSAGFRPVSPIFLLFGETAISAFGIHFWLLASELMSPEQSKKHFPSLALVGAIGAILAGGVVQFLPGVRPRDLLPLLLIPAALCAGLSWSVARRYGYRVGPRRAIPVEHGWAGELREGLRLLRDSRLLVWLALLTALVTSVGLMADFQYLVAAEHERAISRLPSFLGGIQVTVNLLQVALVLSLRSRIFKTFGLITTLGSYPLGGLLLGGLELLSSTGWAAIGFKVFDRLENYVILNPGVGIVLNAFPKDRRGRASIVYGGLIKPAAIAVTATGLLLLRATPSAVSVGIAGVFLAMLVTLRQLRSSYRQALVENLASEDSRLVANSIEALAEPEHRAAVPMLLDFLGRTREPIFVENVLRAAGQIGDPRFVPVLMAAMSGENRSLKRAAAASLARFPTPEVREALLTALRDEDSARVKASIVSALSAGEGRAALYPVLRAGLRDGDPRVRANAVEAVGLTRDARLIAELRPFLADNAPRILANAIVALARVPAERSAAVAALESLLEVPEPSLRVSALYAAGEVRLASSVPAIRRGCADSDPDVHRNAAIALGKFDDPAAIPLLADLLTGPLEQARATALAIDRLGPEVREGLLARLTRASAEGRARAIEAIRTCGLNYPDELEQLESIPARPPPRTAPPMVLDSALIRQ